MTRVCTKCNQPFELSQDVTKKLGYEQRVCADCAFVALCNAGIATATGSEFDCRKPLTDANNPSRGLFYRLRIYRSPFDLTNLVEEQVTSANASAEVLNDGEHARLLLNRDDVRWLHARLGELVQIIDAEDATETQG